MSNPWQSWLESALRAHRTGDLAGAEAACHRVLSLQPDQPDACHLLGVVARLQGNLPAAERWLRHSLAARPAQPQVWNRLGNVLLAVQRPQDALQAFDMAIRLQPDYGDALYNQARACHALGQREAAMQSLDAACALAGPPSAAMWQLRAQLQADAGQLPQALQTLTQALEVAPERAALWHNRAVVLQRLHRHGEALQAHERAAALGLDEADAHYNLGNTLQSLGQLDAAAQAYRRALHRQPQHLLALLDLARLRWRQGDADFDHELRQAQHAGPAAAQVAMLRAQLLARAERFADAATAYREALQWAPDDASCHDGLGRCLMQQGQHDAGLAAQRQACALEPANAGLHCSLAASLIACGRPESALPLAEHACGLDPMNQLAQALRQLSWRLLGDARAWTVQDLKNLVTVVELPQAAEGPDLVGIAKQLRSMHRDRQAPLDQTLRGGTQTKDNLFDQQHEWLAGLQHLITLAVTETIARWSDMNAPDDARAGHPFLGRLPSDPTDWRFSGSWSSKLTRQGFHTDHVHPQGWISGVVYLSVPPVAADVAQCQGWLRFGVPERLPLGVSAESLVMHQIQPAAGRLVLFPSMLWHGTFPFDEDAERLTIAFDLVPGREPKTFTSAPA